MQFRTVIDIKSFDRKIDHSSRILSLGSCFADNIARRMQRAKFRVEASPTGILFNPESIARAVERFAASESPAREELRHDGERYFGYDFHSAFADADPERALAAMREAARRGADALRRADTVIITFGTAWIYRLRENGEVVANCHKQPQSLFARELLAADRIADRYAKLLEGPLADKHVIFTVSPVRHLGDGAERNSLSKAVLRVAVGELASRFPDADYFPSFEIMNDELRDYRFYADDMTHPSQTAVDYIWERFGATAFAESARRAAERAERIAEAAEHRPFDPRGETHRNFCRAMLRRIDELRREQPQMQFDDEKEYFNSFLEIN
ncbi:GSCFA family protein [Alistipes sp. Z76]|nr:GSCFA family protein [Alistipes sp. Z76]NCE66937.1 GSCFA family protein [Muribaculaceae bacterium M3]